MINVSRTSLSLKSFILKKENSPSVINDLLQGGSELDCW